METTCGSLIKELQKIWDEVGEPEPDRDKMLLELEQECLEAYRRRVDQASKSRAKLRQTVADSEAELAYITASLGDLPLHMKQLEGTGSLKQELKAIMPQLEMMRKRRSERRSQFADILHKIRDISEELGNNSCMPTIDENDLSLKRLEELKTELLVLEKEKSDRLKQVLDHLNTLKSVCAVLGMDFKHTINEIHPNLENSGSTKSISTETIERLSTAICSLKELKLQRMQRLQDLATTMVELWSLMDIPIEEQQPFHSVTRNIAASEYEITEANALSLETINFAETEMLRLQQMKASKIKEVLLKKRLDLEELCRKAHMVVEKDTPINYSIEALESGAIDPLYLLEQVELQIAKVKEESYSRKDILEKVEKWLVACEEEHWLEEYNRDQNRYNSGKGTHLLLKRAEKARALVHKIPAMVEALSSKAIAWEQERGVAFSYDGVLLLSMLEDYKNLKHEREQERQRQRDMKKLQGQLITEQEAFFGSKPSPLNSGKKLVRPSTEVVNNRRFSVGGAMLQNVNNGQTPLSSHHLSKKSSAVKPHSLQNHQQRGGLTTIYAGKKYSENTPARQPSTTQSNERERKLEPARKPLSPVSSKLNSANNNHDQNAMHSGALQPFNKSSPLKKTSPIKTVDDGLLQTPQKMPIPTPTTPATTSVAMKTTMTPTPHVPPCGVEYSFEERRAGFNIAETHSPAPTSDYRGIV